MDAATDLWLTLARRALLSNRHSVGVDEVGSNDLYELIRVGTLPHPPATSESGRGRIFTEVFNTEYYKLTNKRIKSTRPESKSRRVLVWKYDHMRDTRPYDGRSDALFEGDFFEENMNGSWL